jgi:hypothetical protein
MDWIYTENPFGPDEKNFIFHEHDFVALQEYDDSWLDDCMTRFIGYCNRGFLKVSLFTSYLCSNISPYFCLTSDSVPLVFIVRSLKDGRSLRGLLFFCHTQRLDQDFHRDGIDYFAADSDLYISLYEAVSYAYGGYHSVLCFHFCDGNLVIHQRQEARCICSDSCLLRCVGGFHWKSSASPNWPRIVALMLYEVEKLLIHSTLKSFLGIMLNTEMDININNLTPKVTLGGTNTISILQRRIYNLPLRLLSRASGASSS